ANDGRANRTAPIAIFNHGLPSAVRSRYWERDASGMPARGERVSAVLRCCFFNSLRLLQNFRKYRLNSSRNYLKGAKARHIGGRNIIQLHQINLICGNRRVGQKFGGKSDHLPQRERERDEKRLSARLRGSRL